MKTLTCVSLAFVLATTLGCGGTGNPPKNDGTATSVAQTPPKEEAAHSHGSGPHGGTLSDWGGGAYHVEFTVNHDKKEATVYILGSDAKSPSPVKVDKVHLSIADPPIEIDLAPQPLDGEKDGVSRFVGTHDNLGKVQEFAGTISGEVDSTPYTGDFKEVPDTRGNQP
jgi:hypothetical protein